LKKYDVVIIGAGPAGMACALELFKIGVKNIIVYDRNESLGGVLNQCIHPGFGLTYFSENHTGPEYASRLAEEFAKRRVPFMLNTMVIDLSQDRVVTASSKKYGIERIMGRAVVIAAGCRESSFLTFDSKAECITFVSIIRLS